MLSRPTVTIGRASTNDIVIDDPRVSRAHARCDFAGGRWTILDLQSGNGTWVNGNRVTHVAVSPGDTVRLGGSILQFRPVALADDPEMTIIDTEAQLGGALATESLTTTLANTAVPRLAIHTPERTWEVTLTGDAYTIGRTVASDIVLPFPQVSRGHAVIERRGNRFAIRDTGSANGVWLGARRIEAEPLGDGDTVRIGPARLTFKPGFQPHDLTVFEVPGARRHSPGRPPVVFVPGFMGSELWRGEERIWPNVRHLLTHPESFRFPDEAALEARGIAGDIVVVPNLIKLDCYNRVGDYLVDALSYERGKDLLEFGYDWRKDVRDSAQQLAKAIETWNVKEPITLVAHSLGCLVVRWYVERLGGKSRVGRLVLIGGPNQGVPRMVSALFFGRKLLPFGILGQRLAEVTATFPSIYQIQPAVPCGIDQDGKPVDLFADDRWLPEPYRPLLYEAKQFRRQLGARSSVPTVSIFGYGLKTITSIRVRRDVDGRWQKLDFGIEPGGDDCIPQTSAVLDGTEIHPVAQSHGSLYVDNDVRMRLKHELTRAAGEGP